MKHWTKIIIGTVLALTGCSQKPLSYTDYVDTKIGTGGHGHVFVGANVPFGMVQLGPTSIPQTWDWCSGYHDSDSTVIGFSHTHLSYMSGCMPWRLNYARGVTYRGVSFRNVIV